MLVFPHAKINIGLNVVERRADGFHEIESILVPIPLRDALEMIVDPDLPHGSIHYERTGLAVAGDPEQDLCMRAVRSIGRNRDLPGIRMHLHKVIPMGAGLGGGSSDGAHALLLLDELLGLGIPLAELHDLASELGSDCPFFLQDHGALVTGRGELLSPISLDLKGYWLVLVNTGLHVGTAEVYKNTKPTERRWDLGTIMQQTSPKDWGRVAPNVMEEYVYRKHPQLVTVKERLQEAGAIHPAMSGSGSSVFGIFRGVPPTLEWPSTYASWVLPLT